MLAGCPFMTSCMRPLYDFAHGASWLMADFDIMSDPSLLKTRDVDQDGSWALGAGRRGLGRLWVKSHVSAERHEETRTREIKRRSEREMEWHEPPSRTLTKSLLRNVQYRLHRSAQGRLRRLKPL
jgi:hypothetical protein